MDLLAFLVLGLVAGFIGSKLVNKSGSGLLMDIIVGVIGSFVGGWVFNKLGYAGVSGLNLYSLLVAVIGAVLLLLIWRAIMVYFLSIRDHILSGRILSDIE